MVADFAFGLLKPKVSMWKWKFDKFY